jgi:hypothetical protein
MKPSIIPGSTTPAVEKIRGGTKVLMTLIIVLGVLLTLLVGAFVFLLCSNQDFLTGYGSSLWPTISAALFTLLGFIGGHWSVRGKD